MGWNPTRGINACDYSLLVLSCVLVAVLRRAVSPSNESYRQCIGSKTKLRVRERTTRIPTERPPLVGEVIAKFADRGCHVVSVTDPNGRILDFLDRRLYFSIK
jgi:hypothetical protein